MMVMMLMVMMVVLMVLMVVMLMHLASFCMRRRLPKTPLISTEAAPDNQMYTQGFDRLSHLGLERLGEC